MILSFVRTPYTITTCIWRRMKDSIMRHHLINQIKTILQNSLIYRRLYLTLQSARRYRVYYKTKISTIVDKTLKLWQKSVYYKTKISTIVDRHTINI